MECYKARSFPRLVLALSNVFKRDSRKTITKLDSLGALDLVVPRFPGDFLSIPTLYLPLISYIVEVEGGGSLAAPLVVG